MWAVDLTRTLFLGYSGKAQADEAATQEKKEEIAKPEDILTKAGYATMWDEEKLDVNKQVWLQLTFFKQDDNSEQFITLFKSNYIPFGVAGAREQCVSSRGRGLNVRLTLYTNKSPCCLCRPLSILLSNMNLYLLQPKRKRASMLFSAGVEEAHEEEELVSSHDFNTIKRITVGPFYQWFRIEFDAQQILLFLTRCHARTHEFVQTLRQTIRDRIGFIGTWCRHSTLVIMR
jgi:hypothetical protein